MQRCGRATGASLAGALAVPLAVLALQGPGASRYALCAAGRQLPEVYLLGAQKSGTSSLAAALARAGVPSACGRKECHFFDALLPFAGAGARAAWLSLLGRCPWAAARSAVADFTPCNLRLVPLPPGTAPVGFHWGQHALVARALGRPRAAPPLHLPRLLRALYGPAAARLLFLVVLREPLARMQSSWYASRASGFLDTCSDCRGPSFRGALEGALRAAARGGPYADWLWASMYARQLEVWLAHFAAARFVVVPFRAYVEGDRRALCRGIAERAPVELDCRGFSESAARNRNAHPPTADDATPRLRKQFDDVMDAEALRLGVLLSQAYADGAFLANYSGSGDVDSVQRWLRAGW